MVNPDLVGDRFSFEEYTLETMIIQKLMGVYYIYSFEMKVNLHFGNLKEAYSQAVSNSSWANKRYLVALVSRKELVFGIN